MIAALPSLALPETHRVDLPAGRLDLTVHHADRPLESLLTFASRRNPRRGFLFVSTVLGRYTPVPVGVAQAVQQALARRIPTDLPGPVVVLALAEAGVGLGAGVHQAYRRLSGRDDVVFLHSTRHRCPGPLLVEFDEPHSHAPNHRVYQPQRPAIRDLVQRARSLVLVDDEVTTGRTFARVLRALSSALPRLKVRLPLVLTDWSGTAQLPDGTPVQALLHGQYAWTRDPLAPPVQMPDVVGGQHVCALPSERDDGRFGVRQPRELPCPTVRPGARVLVLGTGEYQGAPMRLAAALAASGADAWFQATTRAPVLPGGPITSVLRFRDNYGEGLPNYLYNFQRARWDQVFLCQETPAGTACPELLRATGATLIG